MNISIGDVLLHKVTGFKMVVLEMSEPSGSSLNCRYYNDKTGYYTSGWFNTIEFDKAS